LLHKLQQRTLLLMESRPLRRALLFAASALTTANSVTVCQSFDRRRAKRTPHATCLLRSTAVGRSSPAVYVLQVYIHDIRKLP
jgi:hypothetical protein